MAVAHVTAVASHANAASSVSQASFSWTHTTTTDPQGVLVMVFQGVSGTDAATSVTYGGTTVPAVSSGFAADTATEPGSVKFFFLGSGVPTTDNPTVVVNRTNNTTTMWAVSVTVTAGGDTTVSTPVTAANDAAIAEQSVDDGSPGTNSLRYSGVYYGGATPAPAGTNSTLLFSNDIGNYGFTAVRETTAGQGARLVGCTQATSDDRAIVALAIKEVPAGTNWTQTPADTLGLSDTGVSIDHGETGTDAVGITDTATPQLVAGNNFTRDINDSVGITDSFVLPGLVSQTDPVGLTDSIAFTRVVNLTFNDSVGVTDSAAVLGPQRFITQILGTGQTQYPADQAGAPIMVKGDVVWAFPASLGRWSSGDWQGDATTYLTTRKNQGFNLLMIGALPSTQNGASSNTGTFDGISPWASGVIGNLNTTYWDRVEYLVDQAANRGITVLVNLAYSTDMDTASLAGATNSQYTNYGTNVGNRFKTKPNIIWGAGGDYFGTFDTQLGLLFTALQATGDTHLISIQNYPETTSRKDISNSSTASAAGTSWSDWNFVYTYNVNYFGIEYAYTEASPICVIWGDGHFYQNSTADRKTYRDQTWWALSDGARGLIHGSEGVWNWGSSSQTNVANENVGNVDLGNYWNTITSYTGWHQLVPDTDSSFMTAGRGTRKGTIASGGGGTEYTGSPQDAYVTGSVTPDGTLAVVYFPTATTVTINPAELVASYTVKWVDPTNGAETPTSIASTYTPTGNNALGGADRLLVFQQAASTDWTQTPADTVGLTDSVAISTTKGQTDAVGLTDAVVVSDGNNLLPIDSIGIADAAAITQGDVEADAVGLTDAITQIAAWDRSQSENVGITDSATIQASGATNLTPTESVGITDSVVQVHNWVLAITDSVGVTDAASTAASGAASVNQTDPVGLTDSPALTRGQNRTDSIGLTDTAQVARVLTRTDAENLTDQITLGKSAAMTDAVGLSDHVTVVGGTSAERDIVIIGVTDPLSGWLTSDLVVPHVITAGDIQTPVWAITDPANVWALTDPVVPTSVAAGDVAQPTLTASDPTNDWVLTGPDTVSWTMADPVL